MKRAIIPIIIGLGVSVYGVNSYSQYKNEQLIDRIRKSEYNPQTMIEVKLEGKRR